MDNQPNRTRGARHPDGDEKRDERTAAVDNAKLDEYCPDSKALREFNSIIDTFRRPIEHADVGDSQAHND